MKAKQKIARQKSFTDKVPDSLIFSAMSILAASEGLHWILFDQELHTVASSSHAHRLMKRLFPGHRGKDLPMEIKDQLRENMQTDCPNLALDRSCSFKLYLQQGHLACYLYALHEIEKPPAYVLKLIPNGPTEDFSILMEVGLTERETAVLSYLPLGYANSQIAAALDIGTNGVKKHLSNIARKMDASGRAETLYKALLKKRELHSKKWPDSSLQL